MSLILCRSTVTSQIEVHYRMIWVYLWLCLSPAGRRQLWDWKPGRCGDAEAALRLRVSDQRQEGHRALQTGSRSDTQDLRFTKIHKDFEVTKIHKDSQRFQLHKEWPRISQRLIKNSQRFQLHFDLTSHGVTNLKHTFCCFYSVEGINLAPTLPLITIQTEIRY